MRKVALVALGVLIAQTADGGDLETEDVPSHQTNPAFWARGGWRDLRWGMGPGDVAERLKKSPGLRSLLWTSVTELSRRDPLRGVGVEKWWEGPGNPHAGELIAYLPDQLLGWEGIARLRFGQAGLQSVTLDNVAGGETKNATAEGVVGRFERIRRSLTAIAGKPSCRTYADGRVCEWRAGAVRTQLRLFNGWGVVVGNLVAPLDRLPTTALAYEDPRSPDSQTRRLTQSDISARTDPAKWSPLGIDDVRLGMGLGDVLSLLKERSASLECDRPEKGRIRCRGGCVFMCAKSSEKEIRCDVQEGCALTRSGFLLRELAFAGSGILSSVEFSLEGSSRERIAKVLVQTRNALWPLFPGYDARGIDWADDHFSFGLGGPGPLAARRASTWSWASIPDTPRTSPRPGPSASTCPSCSA